MLLFIAIVSASLACVLFLRNISSPTIPPNTQVEATRIRNDGQKEGLRIDITSKMFWILVVLGLLLLYFLIQHPI